MSLLSTKSTHKALRLRRGALFFAIAVLIFIGDQLTKSLIRANLLPGQSIPEDGWFRITHVTNTGAAFGIFADQSAFLLITTAVGVTAIVAYYLFPPTESPLLTASLGLQLGGAVGNLLDRLRLGHVTDFLDFRVWPVFNVADSAIVVGVTVLAFFLFFGDRFSQRPPDGAADSGPSSQPLR